VTLFEQYSGVIRVRAAALIMRDKELLLVKQKVPVRARSVWLPPGGGIEVGETAEAALVREVAEETGVQIRPLRLRYIHEFIQDTFHAYELYYSAEMVGGILKKGSDPEHNPEEQLISRVEWVPVDQLLDSNFELFPHFLRDEIAGNNLSDNTISHFSTR
jgi:8-oxo-dGTP diphosphatase